MAANPARVSAHATHSPDEASPVLGAYRQAAATGADYVELDIRRTADGELVAFHDPATSEGHPLSALGYARLCDLAGYEVPRVADALAAIRGRAKGHLDLKDTGGEPEVARLALDILGPGGFIVTSPEDASIAAIRARFPDAGQVPLALSLGRGLPGAPRAQWLRTRASELRPLSRVRVCGADSVAANRWLALAGVARQCRRHHVQVMAWTVNSEPEIRYWLSRGRADVVITDRPALAVALRDAKNAR